MVCHPPNFLPRPQHLVRSCPMLPYALLALNTMKHVINRIRFAPVTVGTLAVLLLLPTPSFAAGFWSGFKNYWVGFIGAQNGIVMTVLGLGALGIFIVTRGKWRK